MGEKTWLGTWCLGAALVLGALGDMLLRGTPWGINVVLWLAALVVLMALPMALRRISWTGGGRWMLLAALLFAAFVAWRDSTFLAFLNVCAALASISLAAVWGRAGRLLPRGVSEYGLACLYTGAFTSAGPISTAVSDIEWDEVSSGGSRKPILAVLRGLLIAAPLLFVFGGLLIAADAVFEEMVLRFFDFDAAQVFGHAFLVLFLAWISAGYLRVALVEENAPNFSMRRPSLVSLGVVESSVVLGLLNALFLAFVVVQARYLFGGDQRVAAGLTYAEYARRGFFELVAVTALALSVLLLAHWLHTTDNRLQTRLFNSLAAMMVALVSVIMVSALWRMHLYYVQFGLTELRLYATAFMLWLAVILALFLATVLRDRRELFGAWTLASGFAAILILNLINPDALIARANIERMENGKRFDAYYLTLLSADAAPVIVKALPEIGEQNLAPDYTLEQAFLDRWKSDGGDDWRTWNLSRSKAQKLAETHASDRSSI
ncbi:MAG: DUF4153 domain-containing protein [Rubrobacteraceae bacterium]